MTVKGITLNEAKHAFTFLVSEDSDGDGYLSRDSVPVAGGMGGLSFVVGEILAVVGGYAVKLNPTATDGSQHFGGIAGYRVNVVAGDTEPVTIINAHAVVRGSDLTYPAGATSDQIAAINAEMYAKLIKIR